MEYDESVLSELAMMLVEGDISYQCSRYHIPGYDREDLEQECRMRVWQKIMKFNADRGISFRTWSQNVIKNHLKNLLRDSTREVRRANNAVVYITNREYLIFEDKDGQEENTSGDLSG